MIYLSQNILSTNSELYIPSSATIVGSSVSEFKRGSVVTEVPMLVYYVLPGHNPSADNNETPINSVLNSNRSRYHGHDTLPDDQVVKVRVFLVPLNAQQGNAVCTYAIPATNRHIITQYQNVRFKNIEHSFYVETLSNGLPPVPTTTQQPSSSGRSRSSSLGPAVRQEDSIRIIN